MKLHIGSGNVILEDWVNIDEHPYPDVIPMGLPNGLVSFGTDSIDCIYSSHFLEHLSYPDQATEFIQECYRILRPGGVIRTVVPNIESIIFAYVKDDREFFKLQADLHPDWCITPLNHLMYSVQQDGEHKYGYDYYTLNVLLKNNGFRLIEKNDYNRSRITKLNVDYRRMTDNNGKDLSLFVDATK